jgi:predicted DNA-binding protein (MmcQ/YjbR family)
VAFFLQLGVPEYPEKWQNRSTMDVDAVREFCLSFADAKEKLQWGEELCFKVGGKIFAMLSLGSVPPTLICKSDPAAFAELTEREGIVAAPYVGRYKWIKLESLDAVPGEELKQLITRSYALIKTKSTKRNHKRSRPSRPAKRRRRNS